MASPTRNPSQIRDTTRLEDQVSSQTPGLWPTPTVCGNYNRPKAGTSSGTGLITAVMSAYNPATRMGRRLSVEWVTWLMGWPAGWTDPSRAVNPEALAHWDQAHERGTWYETEPCPRTEVSAREPTAARLKMLGNGWVPRQAAFALRLLARLRPPTP